MFPFLSYNFTKNMEGPLTFCIMKELLFDFQSGLIRYIISEAYPMFFSSPKLQSNWLNSEHIIFLGEHTIRSKAMTRSSLGETNENYGSSQSGLPTEITTFTFKQTLMYTYTDTHIYTRTDVYSTPCKYET